LFGALAGLLLLAAFFAGSETALMSLNRYRLRHRANEGNRGARLAEKLLAHPDRLIGLILLLSTLVNVAAPMLVGFIALRFGGEFLVAFGAGALTLVLLIFCEVAPKTFGALHPERLALPAAYIYTPLLLVLYPFVWATNLLANGVLRLFGVSSQQASNSLSSEELRTVVAEAGAMIPHRHQQMLVSILDLESATVEDIMVPRNEIVGIDVADDWDRVLEQLRQIQHTRLPVYEGEIDRIIGVLHMKQVVHELARGRLDRASLTAAAAARDAYFVPSGTTLNTQLLNFQRNKRRMAFVVDEYGDIQGLVTLEDILEDAQRCARRGRWQFRRQCVGDDSRTQSVHALEPAHGWAENFEWRDRGILGNHPRGGHDLEVGGLHARSAANRRQCHQDRAHSPAGARRLVKTPRGLGSNASHRAPTFPRAAAAARSPPAPPPI
jgi:Mg2+/Co2+ transporter CorB